MRNRLLICLLLAPLISGFGFFGGGGGEGSDGFFNFEFDEGGGSEDGQQTQGGSASSQGGPKTPLCPQPSKPYLCQVSKLIALTYGLGDVCVAHPRDCPCPIPSERKCPLGNDAYICIQDSLPCPSSGK